MINSVAVSNWKRNRLHVLRAERRLTQEAVARKLKMSQARYSQLERAYREPDAPLRERIAKVFGVQADALYQDGQQVAS